MNPIPKRLLPHKAIYKEYLGNQGEGDEWDRDTPLEFIKIEEKLQFKVTNNGRELIGNGKMFYDFINSKGLTNKPSNNSKIIFNGREYIIVETDILCAASSQPHHYEVILK